MRFGRAGDQRSGEAVCGTAGRDRRYIERGEAGSAAGIMPVLSSVFDEVFGHDLPRACADSRDRAEGFVWQCE